MMASPSSQLPPSDTNLPSPDIEKNIRVSSPIRHEQNQGFDPAATKALVRKVDLHLIPFLAIIYLLCFLDRTNVGNARLVNLEADLHMSGLDYNNALAIFFPFYIAAEIPSNLILKRLRPSIWITTIMVAWSVVMISMGFVHTYRGLLACRVFLGIAEGGLFPGICYLITMWYPRHETGFRIALFFSAATAAGAFGGLLARGISEMSGLRGKGGWAWIFILEGTLTLCVSSLGFWLVRDHPSTCKFLTTAEKAEIERRLAADSNALSNDFDLKYVKQALVDWKIWINMVITLGLFSGLYSVALFLPTIIKDLGYTNNTAQLMSVPPYASACVMTIAGSYFADRCKQRGVFLLGFQTIAVVGFIMLAASKKPHVQYGGSFFTAAGVYPVVPLIGAWNSNNIGGTLKRGVGIAMQVGFGNFGGVIAAYVYLPRDAPRFTRGHIILIGLISMSFILTTIMTLYFRRENARRDRVLADMGISLSEYSDEMRWEEREKGDAAIFFRFTV